MKKLIIFDYDGTLADTSPGIRYCYNTTAASMGFAPRLHREDFFGVIGASLDEGFLRLWPDMPQQLLPHAVANYRTLYAKKGKDLPAPLYEGVQQTLLQLKRMGLLLAVATLKHEQFIYDMLRTNQIDGLFDAVCAYKGNEKKSDLLKAACRCTNIHPEKSLLVGDSAFDGQGAQSIPMDFVAALYGWGFQNETEASFYKPIGRLTCFSDLANLLKTEKTKDFELNRKNRRPL